MEWDFTPSEVSIGKVAYTLEDFLRDLRVEIDMNLTKFEIHSHFCIYYQQGFKRSSNKYFLMKKVDGSIEMEESNFEDLRIMINDRLVSRNQDIKLLLCPEVHDYFNIENEHCYLIQEALISSMQKSKISIFLNILIEVKYNIFSHFRSSEGYLGFMEALANYLANLKNSIRKYQMKLSELRLKI